MKRILFICIAAAVLSCNMAAAQVVVKGNTLLLGKINIQQLEQSPFAEWYKTGYTAYQPDSLVKDSLATLVKSYRFELFFGTWCGDSQREVPRIMKLLDDLHIKPSDLTIIAVGNSDTLYKQSPAHEEKGKSILRVPTLNVYMEGKEVGRIIEIPAKSWEKDLLSILNKRP